MKKKGERKKVVNVSISPEILKSSKLSIDEVHGNLADLAAIFKGKFHDLVPKTINDLSTLNFIVSLNENLRRLKNCKGFSEHIAHYKKYQIQSTYFVTLLASFLISKVDKLILEPGTRKKKKRPDIFVKFKDEEVYIECKTIDLKLSKYLPEHRHMFEILAKYLDLPHQVSITYRNSLSDEEIEKLGGTLKERIPQVTNEGTIIDNEDIEVQVIPRDEHSDSRIGFSASIVMERISDNCKYPGHLFMEQGCTVSICGPLADFSKYFKNKIEKSRRQLSSKKPYILAIASSSMLGDPTNNLRFLSTRFQPDANTRFSGILLVNYGSNLFKDYIEFKFISNPFAKYPVSKGFERLFKDSKYVKTN